MMRRLLGDTAVYGISSVLQKSLGFLLLPIYTRHLTRAEFGVVAFIVSVLTVVEVFVTCSVSSGVTRFYYEHERRQRASLAASALVFSAVTGALVVGVGLLLAPCLAERVWRIRDGALIFRVALVGLFFSSVGQLFPNLVRLNSRKWSFVGLSVLSTLLSAAFMVYWVAWAHKGALGLILGTTCGSATQFVLFGLAAAVHCRGWPSWPFLRKVLSFSIPIVFVNLSGIVKGQTDKWFLKLLCDLDQLGLYAIGEKFASIVALLGVTTFALAWSPYILSFARNEQKQKKILCEVSDAYLYTLFLLTLTLSVFSPHVLHMMSPKEYYSAASVVLPLCLVWVFLGIGNVWVIGVHMSLKTKYLPLCVFCGMVLNAVFNALLIPRLGIVGAASASAFSSGLISLSYLWIAERHFPAHYRFGRTIRGALLFLVLAGAGQFACGRLTLRQSGLVGGAIVAIFAVVGGVVMVGRQTWFDLLGRPPQEGGDASPE